MTVLAMIALSALWLAAGLHVLAPRKAGYRHARHTLSELGETGAPDQRLVAYGLFLPVGLLLLVVAALVRPQSGATAALALCVAVGYVGAALFPCDPGSPMWGSPRQALHNLAGAVEYGGGCMALLTLARELGTPLQVAGFVVLGATVAISVLPSSSSPRGAIQRVAEACLFGGLAWAAWRTGAVA